MIQPRILYFDNRRDHLKLWQKELESEGYLVETYLVDSPDALEHLEHRLKTEWWHLVLADINLRDRAGRDDYGLKIVIESDPIVPKILWTDYPQREFHHIEETLTPKVGQLLPPAAYYVSKHLSDEHPGGLDTLLSKIQQTLEREPYHINYKLDISLEDRNLLRMLATQIKFVHQHAMDAAQELEDLFRKLFSMPACTSVSIVNLPYRPSTGALVRVDAEDKEGFHESVIVHWGLRGEIQKIKNNHYEFLRWCKSAETLERHAETLNYAGLVYSLKGAIEHFHPFDQTVVHAKDSSSLELTLEQLFAKVLKPLYHAKRSRTAIIAFDELYRSALGLNGNQDRFARAIEDVLAKHPLVERSRDYNHFYISTKHLSFRVYDPKMNRVVLYDPTEVVFYSDGLFNLDVPAEEGITYGYLNENAFLIDPEDHIWLLGSLYTGRGFYLRDFIALEASIMLRLIVRISPDLDDALMLDALLAWLTPNHLEEQVPTTSKMMDIAPSAYGKVLAAVSYLRQLAKRFGDVDMRYYYGGLLFHAAQLVLEAKKPRVGPLPSHYPHAALASALLATRLLNWPELTWPLDPKERKDMVKLNEETGEIYIPHSGKWTKLRPQLIELMRLLTQNPKRIIAPDDIKDHLGEVDLARLLWEIRQILELDPKKPRYIITRPGLGIEFHPEGQD